ncbi:MAG: aspartyl protease family protein [Candidatus Aminicenantes bacterium]|nr:MAG: aspartyl protease family protein [Candidatus Aminicenantes bacterium]
MKKKNIFALSILIIVTISIGLYRCGKKELSDPLHILEKYCAALGGLEKLKAQQSFYYEAEFNLDNLKGTMKHWYQAPNLSRQELDLKVFKSISGDNGQVTWSIDQNRKLLVHKDEETIKRRKVQQLLQNYEFMNPQSQHFTLTFAGLQKIRNSDCYVVKISNTINSDLSIRYINTKTFLMEKSVDTRPTEEIRQVYSDYREVKGIKHPFHREVTRLPVNQTFSLHITKYESGIPIDASLFQLPRQDVRDFRFLTLYRAENIPFRYVENHILLTVNIKGKESLWILDSGAGSSVIDLGFARTLGLNPEGKVKGEGIGKTVDISFVTVPSITLPGLVMEKQTIAAADFITTFCLKAFGMDIKGILGYDFMSRFVIKVDYANEKISFYHPDKFQYNGKGKILEAPLIDRNFTVPMTVDGKYTGNWRVDLGSGGIDFHYPYAKEKGFPDRKGIDGMSYGAGGGIKTRAIRFKKLEFAGFTLSDPLIGFPLREGEGAFMDKTLLGNVGNAVFRHFVIYLDYKNQQLIVEKGKHFDYRFPENRSGLQLMAADRGEIEVVWVSPGTPAHQAGFKKGDIIKTVNHTDAASVGVIATRNLFKGKIGTRYDVTVLRNGKHLHMQLELRDLY